MCVWKGLLARLPTKKDYLHPALLLKLFHISSGSLQNVLGTMHRVSHRKTICNTNRNENRRGNLLAHLIWLISREKKKSDEKILMVRRSILLASFVLYWCSTLTVLNVGSNKLKSFPHHFMAAARFLRVCGSPLKWLEVWVVFFLFHFIELQAEVIIWSEKRVK